MLNIIFKHSLISVISLSVLLWPQKTLAAAPPNLVSPSDNSIVSKSPKLTWEYAGECIESGSCFRAEVDDSADFSSPEKSTYTNSLSYSPQGLTEGSWYWRVKAKDKSDKWSDWSKVFKFTIGAESTGSSPTSSSQATSTPQVSPSNQKPSASFTIKDIPSDINSDQEFEASISLFLPNNPNQKFYLKGAFKKSDSLNYFGQTFAGEWVKNNSSYSAQFKIETDQDGKWEGKIKVRPDADDSGFDGSDNYIFKVARYTDSGNGPVWSNELSLKINAVATPEPSSSDEPEEIAEKELDEEIDLTGSIIKDSPKKYEIKIASVAGEATMSNNITPEEPVRVLEDKKINWFLITLGAIVILSGIGYCYFKLKRGKLHAIS